MENRETYTWPCTQTASNTLSKNTEHKTTYSVFDLGNFSQFRHIPTRTNIQQSWAKTWNSVKEPSSPKNFDSVLSE